ncbi:hypothetical protein IZ6_06170 [Terrihabitans soli]|uniref:Peptidase S1 domain-containing protein n=1 Tax=Terrihabitans soli TaxID=708113 RepID=A0A6S6QRI3_9HYPH|nr:S1 family peptidase [Terrihabitans soli]BCJ89882.1 hypothetical protein IZ6_06170 [Terrihabitans soli]
MRFLLGLLLLSSPALALDGGTSAGADQPLSRAAVAIQAVSPQPDGTARLSECTGVLIARDLVLTAAHCLDEAAKPEHVAVFFFAGSKAVPPFQPVAKIVRHAAHTKGWAKQPGDIETRQKEIASDLAVLRLKTPAPAAQTVLQFDAQTAPDVLTLAGAGIAGPDGRSGTLKTASLAAIRHTQTGPNLAFATPGKSQVCRGDSGGPVITATGALWGISGAILRATKGCSGRMVVVPVNPADFAIAAMIAAARTP